ncbi:MAG: hypothetical protein AAGI91_12010 [Bacteroidota bacterium]
MAQSLSLPRKLARLILPIVGLLALLTGWQYVTLPEDLPESTETIANAILLVSMAVGGLLLLGFVQRLRRKLRTRSRYLLWTFVSAYFLGALFLVLRFGQWSGVSVTISVLCVFALGLSIWGATAERQRTIEYTLFPSRPRKARQAEGEAESVRQGA